MWLPEKECFLGWRTLGWRCAQRLGLTALL
jgi:hypothetical protein